MTRGQDGTRAADLALLTALRLPVFSRWGRLLRLLQLLRRQRSRRSRNHRKSRSRRRSQRDPSAKWPAPRLARAKYGLANRKIARRLAGGGAPDFRGQRRASWLTPGSLRATVCPDPRQRGRARIIIQGWACAACALRIPPPRTASTKEARNKSAFCVSGAKAPEFLQQPDAGLKAGSTRT